MGTDHLRPWPCASLAGGAAGARPPAEAERLAAAPRIPAGVRVGLLHRPEVRAGSTRAFALPQVFAMIHDDPVDICARRGGRHCGGSTEFVRVCRLVWSGDPERWPQAHCCLRAGASGREA